MCNCENKLIPKSYEILSIEKHTELEWNFRVVKDFKTQFGQFVQASLPMVGEAPISVSDYGNDYVDLLIRKVGKLTNKLFELKVGDNIWMRGAYGNGYNIENLNGKHIIVVAGGTGVAPVKGLINYFCSHPEKINSMDMILGFKNLDAVLYKNEFSKWTKTQNLIVTLDEGEKTEEYQIGLVTDHIDKLDISFKDNIEVIVVGPPVMIKFVVTGFMNKGISSKQIWVDYERRMQCAVGKCGHCRIGDKYVCLDGPVFRFDQARQMID
ncbi:MAG: anaerobic sulfite reductase subunit AsrB [bacterium]|nr:anaerobic sulfite reductase subunit AsrB [bacterium]